MGRKQYRYDGVRTIKRIKGLMISDLESIGGIGVSFTETDTGEIRGRGKHKRKIKGVTFRFDMEDQYGRLERYKIESLNGYDTKTNYWLIYTNIQQRVRNIKNGVSTAIDEFNDVKMLTEDVGSDPYSVLGVTPNMSNDQIKRVYRESVKIYHPDKMGEVGEAHFKEIQRAWNLIKIERNID
jgi:hypothetical protein